MNKNRRKLTVLLCIMLFASYIPVYATESEKTSYALILGNTSKLPTEEDIDKALKLSGDFIPYNTDKVIEQIEKAIQDNLGIKDSKELKELFSQLSREEISKLGKAFTSLKGWSANEIDKLAKCLSTEHYTKFKQIVEDTKKKVSGISKSMDTAIDIGNLQFKPAYSKNVVGKDGSVTYCLDEEGKIQFNYKMVNRGNVNLTDLESLLKQTDISLYKIQLASSDALCFFVPRVEHQNNLTLILLDKDYLYRLSFIYQKDSYEDVKNLLTKIKGKEGVSLTKLTALPKVEPEDVGGRK